MAEDEMADPLNRIPASKRGGKVSQEELDASRKAKKQGYIKAGVGKRKPKV